jgi:flagellar biosynthetic protein FliQ
MTTDLVLSIGEHALWIMLLVAAPLLASALVVGLVVSVLQAATQVNEMTLSFIPKLIALVLTLVVAGPWMLDTLVGYTRELITRIPTLIG